MHREYGGRKIGFFYEMRETEMGNKRIGSTVKLCPFSLPLILFDFKVILPLFSFSLKLSLSSLFFTALETRIRISTHFPPL